MILFCGEALIDMVMSQVGDTRCYLPRPGGAALNGAISLARLGRRSGLFAGLSTDLFGAQLDAVLAIEGVDTSFCTRSPRPTTLAFAEVHDGTARFAFMDENSAGRLLNEADLPVLGNEITAVHFSGISLVGEPCGNAFEALATRESGRRLIVLDPNIRPALIPDAAAHRDRITRMVALADIVKVSEEDLDWLRNPDPSRWLGTGASLVIVTRGEHGATAFTARHTTAAEPPRKVVGNTVGAGDNFLAGVLAQLDRDELLDPARLAILTEEQVGRALDTGCRAAALRIAHAAGRAPSWSQLQALAAGPMAL